MVIAGLRTSDRGSSWSADASLWKPTPIQFQRQPESFAQKHSKSVRNTPVRSLILVWAERFVRPANNPVNQRNKMLLKNKIAVIYGGGGAIGGAVARTFAREGAKVFLAGRTRSK